MIIRCTIDGMPYTFNENTDKPLSRILEENVPSFPFNSKCTGAGCGNCLVIFNNELKLSCLIPAFKVNGSAVVTFEGFKKTRGFRDIERAYLQTECQPCSQCYAAKTLIIETLISKMEQINSVISASSMLAHQRHKLQTINRAMIAKEMAVNPCQCVDIPDLEKIINQAYMNRSSRRVRKSQIS